MPVPRTSRLSVRASPEEVVCWKHIARSFGHVTTSEWIHFLLIGAQLAGHDGPAGPEERRRLSHELSRVGNNLNQFLSSCRKKYSVRSATRHCDTVGLNRHSLFRACVMIVKESRLKTVTRYSGLHCSQCFNDLALANLAVQGL